MVFYPPPPAAQFTWVNQGSGTATDLADGLLMSAPSAGAFNVKGLVQSTPGTPWTATLGYIPDAVAVTSLGVGMMTRASGSGNIVHYDWSGLQPAMNMLKLTSPTVNSGSFYTIVNPPSPTYAGSSLLWLRVVDDGTNRISYYSRDGIYWRLTHTVARTDHLTADQVGLMLRVDGGFASMKVVSWQLVNGVLT